MWTKRMKTNPYTYHTRKYPHISTDVMANCVSFCMLKLFSTAAILLVAYTFSCRRPLYFTPTTYSQQHVYDLIFDMISLCFLLLNNRSRVFEYRNIKQFSCILCIYWIFFLVDDQDKLIALNTYHQYNRYQEIFRFKWIYFAIRTELDYFAALSWWWVGNGETNGSNSTNAYILFIFWRQHS